MFYAEAADNELNSSEALADNDQENFTFRLQDPENQTADSSLSPFLVLTITHMNSLSLFKERICSFVTKIEMMVNYFFVNLKAYVEMTLIFFYT